jgi:hypothetical protein
LEAEVGIGLPNKKPESGHPRSGLINQTLRSMRLVQRSHPAVYRIFTQPERASRIKSPASSLDPETFGNLLQKMDESLNCVNLL